MIFLLPEWRDRYACVEIPLDFLAAKPWQVAHALSRCVVLRAETLIERRTLRYVIASPDFPASNPHSDIPRMTAVFGPCGFERFEPVGR